MGTARAADPLVKALFFYKLAKAVPMESGVVGRSVDLAHIFSQNNRKLTLHNPHYW